MESLNAIMICDFYKCGHVYQYPKGTEIIYSTWTPRGTRLKGIDEVVFFGVQGFIKTELITYFNENFFNRPLVDVIAECKLIIEECLFIQDPDLSHIAALHTLGYLPLVINALPEGSRVPVRVPCFTMNNTNTDFAWLTNALETYISTEIWPMITVATIADEYRRILDSFAMETQGSTEGVDFQAHDFSMRGMSGVNHAARAGSGHLLSFKGTDCIPAIWYLKNNYDGIIEAGGIGCSIPATEHSVQCANMPDDEDETTTILRMITEVYPTGLVSMVMDTNDFWDNVTRVLPSIKDTIMGREGKLVVRPDSGDPIDIICGTLGDIKDYTSVCETMDGLKDWVEQDILEDVRSIILEPGECGPDSEMQRVKWQGKYYDMTLGNIEWNRHDKTYYYHDQWNKYTWNIKEVEVTAAKKGLIEVLWEIFGGTTNDLGYKVLDEHIGAIYGDSITLERAEIICQKLRDKGFASLNIVFGVGSFSYNYHTRDTFNQAFKSTYSQIFGVEKFLSKNPKTDDGMKKSQKGLVCVQEVDGKLTLTEGLNAFYRKRIRSQGRDKLEVVFKDGKLIKDQSLEEIRQRLLTSQ